MTYESGLSSPGRLHDLFINCEAVTPGEYKSKGEGITILYGFHPTPFGECLIGVTPKGICFFGFVMKKDRKSALKELKGHWQKSKMIESAPTIKPFIKKIFNLNAGDEPLNLHLNGTNFQIKVWEALLKIPEGHVVTYEDIAKSIGLPKASRAVGNAVGQNPIPFIIPCHRVIKKIGEFGNYHYGPMRKKLLLGWESANNLKTSAALP